MMLFYGILLVVLVWLIWRIIRGAAALARWHMENRPGARHYLIIMGIPLLVWSIPLFFLLPLAEPMGSVPEEELITIQGTVSEYREGSYKTSRFSSRTRYVDGIYLEGDSTYYDLPGRSFDPEEFAAQIGLAPVTMEYGINEAGRRQVYVLITGAGEELLSYEVSADDYWREELLLFAMLVGVLLWGVGWVLRFPARLSLTGSDEEMEKAVQERKKVGITLVGYGALFLLMLLFSRISSFDDSVHTISTSVNLDGAVRVQLPGQWTWEESENQTWYFGQKDAGLCIQFYDLGGPHEMGVTEEEWYEEYFHSIDGFLRETFLEPGTEPLFEDWEPIRLFGGQSGQIALGQGVSIGGTRNWFATAAFPEKGAAVIFQVSSWDMEWMELEDYAQEYIFPLIPYMEFTR